MTGGGGGGCWDDGGGVGGEVGLEGGVGVLVGEGTTATTAGLAVPWAMTVLYRVGSLMTTCSTRERRFSSSRKTVSKSARAMWKPRGSS